MRAATAAAAAATETSARTAGPSGRSDETSRDLRIGSTLCGRQISRGIHPGAWKVRPAAQHPNERNMTALKGYALPIGPAWCTRAHIPTACPGRGGFRMDGFFDISGTRAENLPETVKCWVCGAADPAGPVPGADKRWAVGPPPYPWHSTAGAYGPAGPWTMESGTA